MGSHILSFVWYVSNRHSTQLAVGAATFVEWVPDDGRERRSKVPCFFDFSFGNEGASFVFRVTYSNVLIRKIEQGKNPTWFHYNNKNVGKESAGPLLRD
jgi:hypothetical protein